MIPKTIPHRSLQGIYLAVNEDNCSANNIICSETSWGLLNPFTCWTCIKIGYIFLKRFSCSRRQHSIASNFDSIVLWFVSVASKNVVSFCDNVWCQESNVIHVVWNCACVDSMIWPIPCVFSDTIWTPSQRVWNEVPLGKRGLPSICLRVLVEEWRTFKSLITETWFASSCKCMRPLCLELRESLVKVLNNPVHAFKRRFLRVLIISQPRIER